VLGPLEGRLDGEPLALGGAKQQVVLALLLCDVHRVVSSERLIDGVWGSGGDADDERGRHAGTLQVYVSNLRRALAPAVERLGRPIIVTRRPGYTAELEEDELDLSRFTTLQRSAIEASSAGRHGDAVKHLRAALSLWRGEALAGLPIEGTNTSIATNLELQRVAVIEQTAQAELAVGRHREVLTDLQAWVEQHPLDERLRGHLMLALYRSGRQADALATFRDARERLVESLGIDPSPELRELEDRILHQDPTLALTAHASPIADGEATELRSSAVVSPAVLELAGDVITLDASLVTIGRRADRDLLLDDAGVSRVHAEIRRTGDSYHLFDAGSANGTIVNGERVGDHTLADGDVIRLGSTELVFRRSSP
jgi:SARP family transcriptional regulator, regulator of embCAB operon